MDIGDNFVRPLRMGIGGNSPGPFGNRSTYCERPSAKREGFLWKISRCKEKSSPSGQGAFLWPTDPPPVPEIAQILLYEQYLQWRKKALTF
jgi:hypothetical protein